MGPDYRQTAVVGLALTAHLDAFVGTSKQTGRQALQVAMGLDNPARVTELLKPEAAPERLLELAVVTERIGLVPHGEVTGIARQIRLTPFPMPTVSGVWWPRLRDAKGLAHGSDELRSVIDVLVCAESFCDYYQELIAKPPNSLRDAVSQVDLKSLDALLRALCRFAVGPYGAAQEAHHLVSRMATLAPAIVAEEVGRNAVSTQLIRSLDSAIRHYHVNANLWRRFSDVLANPPDLLASKIYWLRGLRRLLITDRTRRAERDTRRWAMEQLKIALRGEGAYEDSGATDRRFALWCLAELVENDGEWAHVETYAARDSTTADLIPTCRSFRRSPRTGYDGFAYTPESGWERPRSMVEVLDVARSKTNAWSARATWLIRPTTRSRLVGYLADALLAPSAIRQRAATDLLRGSGSKVRTAVSATVSDLIERERVAAEPRVHVLERCFRVLGSMGQESSIEVVERLLRDTDLDPSVLTAAISASGDLAYRHARRSIGMMAWVNDAMTRSSSRTRAIVGIRAATAFGRDPNQFYAVIPAAEDPSVLRCLAWARSVLDDPLWTARG